MFFIQDNPRRILSY